VKLKTDDLNLVSIFSALGDNTRLKLYKTLRKETEICVSSMADVVGITAAGASQHLKILEKANLINRNRYGQKVCYTINNDNQIIEAIDNIIK